MTSYDLQSFLVTLSSNYFLASLVGRLKRAYRAEDSAGDWWVWISKNMRPRSQRSQKLLLKDVLVVGYIYITGINMLHSLTCRHRMAAEICEDDFRNVEKTSSRNTFSPRTYDLA